MTAGSIEAVPPAHSRTPLQAAAYRFLLLAMTLFALQAWAHPADEFCTGDTGMDPELCRALAELDAAAPVPPEGSESPYPVQAVTIDRHWSEVAVLYLKLGFQHILPKGLDHILFVLALFFASTRLRPLLIQVSVFTVAHTLTLALAAMGLIRVPAGIVEPLIAISIAFVAIENLFAVGITRWRPLVVFFFGLFHGLGFASVLQGLGLPQEQFLTALISFNIGVEFGQLTVICLAWILFFRLFDWSGYRKVVVLPVSFLIGLAGLWWALQRILLA